MPALPFPISDWTPVGGLAADPLVPPGVVSASPAKLRRTGRDGVRFSPDGDLEPAANFVTPNFLMDCLTEVVGIEVGVWDRNGLRLGEDHVSLQITLDDGATYLHWDGVACFA